MITELSKDLIGKTIFGCPTGNNQDRDLTRAGKVQPEWFNATGR